MDMHWKSLVSDVSIDTLMILVEQFTERRSPFGFPNITGRRGISSSFEDTSGTGTATSYSSSWASASNCETMKWPEWMVSFSATGTFMTFLCWAMIEVIFQAGLCLTSGCATNKRTPYIVRITRTRMAENRYEPRRARERPSPTRTWF